MTACPVHRIGFNRAFLAALLWAVAACGSRGAGESHGSAAAEPARCPAVAHERPLAQSTWGSARQQLAPAGALAMRLCRYAGLNGPGPSGRLLRSVLLVRGAQFDQLIGEFDALQPPPPGVINCPADDGSLILALLAYPDGHRLTIQVERLGCQFASTGDLTRTADGYLSGAGPRLERQLNRLTR